MALKTKRSRPNVVLVIGESQNDTESVLELAKAIRPELPTIRTLRRPIVLRRDIGARARRKFAEDIGKATRAAAVITNVVSVIAHRDCDEIEPAHVQNARELVRELTEAGVPQPIAATPAFEIEAWWYLWPDALAATRRCWRIVDTHGANVGLFANAKEKLTRDLRPTGGHRCPDYSECDSPKITRNVRELGIVDLPTAASASFQAFRASLVKLNLSAAVT